jgi:hypothetical protein
VPRQTSAAETGEQVTRWTRDAVCHAFADRAAVDSQVTGALVARWYKNSGPDASAGCGRCRGDCLTDENSRIFVRQYDAGTSGRGLGREFLGGLVGVVHGDLGVELPFEQPRGAFQHLAFAPG